MRIIVVQKGAVLRLKYLNFFVLKLIPFDNMNTKYANKSYAISMVFIFMYGLPLFQKGEFPMYHFDE